MMPRYPEVPKGETGMKDFTELSVQERGLLFSAAVMDRKVDDVRLYLQKGADVHYDDDLPLRVASYLGHLDLVKLLLEHGANVHAGRETALLSAVKNRDAEMAAFLLGKGADIGFLLARSDRNDLLDREDIRFVDELRARQVRETVHRQTDILKTRAKANGHLKLKP